MLLYSSIHISLPDSGPGAVPEWLHLVPAGTFKGVDGRGPFKLLDPAKVIAESEQRLALDENHSTDLAAPQGNPAPARGWIVELQSREDGIWGRVEWCDSGRQLMTEKAYRGISPVFMSDPKTGEVVKLLRAALTNNPNLTQLKTLNSQETGVDLLTKLRKALGLPDTATEAAILETAGQNTAVATAHSASIAAIAAAAGAKATDAAGLVTELQARTAASGDLQQMVQKVTTLETELNTLRASGAREKAVLYVDGAIKAGKPINTLRDHYIERHIADAAAVEKEIGALISINAGGMARPQRNDAEGGGDDELDQEEMAVCKKMGIEPKAFAKQKKAMAAEKAKRGVY